MKKTIKPSPLKKASKIGLVTPSGFITEKQFSFAVKNVENMGFKTFHTDTIFNRSGYLAGNDKERAEDLMKMFTNKSVDGIFCIRGGYGVARILDLLDYDLIRKNPKVFIGFSDITGLLQAFYKFSGLIGFHGVVASSVFNNYTKKYFPSIISEIKTPTTFISDKDKYDYDATDNDIYTISGGKAKGIALGGNLSLMVSMLGTKYDIDWTDKIIYIEEVGEYPYRIDKMLTQLKLAGKFNKLKAVILGVFKGCDLDYKETNTENSFSLKEILLQKFKDLKIPCMYGFSFGHIKSQAVFPYGAEAEFDADKQTLTFQ